MYVRPETTDLSLIWQRWIAAYARLRGLRLERAAHGWWLEVGKPQQSGRYFIESGDVALLQKLASSVVDPAVHFELPVPHALIGHAVTHGWTFAAPEFLMTAQIGTERAPVLPGNLELMVDTDGAEIRASCIHADGHPLSRGVCLVLGTDVIFDQVVTEREARRQGLASAVMAVLAASAVRRGAVHSVLLATADGRPFYEALGWSVLSEVSKVISPLEPRAARHLRVISHH